MAVHAGPDLSELELTAWEGFLQAHARVVRELDGELEAAHGLSLSSFAVLRALRGTEAGRLRMADLAEQAQLSRSGMTRLVDRLERNGLLRRCSCSDDARGCFAVLTPAGAELAEEAGRTYMRGVRERFLETLSAEDLQALSRCFGRDKT